jgi:flagellar biosynthesis protein FlhA
VLQNLLSEGVHIRDMRTILEVIADSAGRSVDPVELTSTVRRALGRAIVDQLFPGMPELPLIALNARLESMLQQALASGGPDGAGIEPGLADTLVQQAAIAAQRQQEMGYSAALLVPGGMRNLLARFLRRAVPTLRVLSHAEIPETKTIRVTALVGDLV